MIIEPIRPYMLVEIEKKEEKTPGGIILLERRKDSLQEGKLIKSSLPMCNNRVGMKVYFKMWAGEPVDNTNYKLVHIKDIVAYEQT